MTIADTDFVIKILIVDVKLGQPCDASCEYKYFPSPFYQDLRQ